MTKSKGIHDPWRLNTPEWEPPPEEAPAGAKGSNLPFDWDLQPDKIYVLRYQDVSIKFVGVETSEGAAAILINAFDQDADVKRVLTEAGFERHVGTGPGFTLTVQDQVLAYPAATNVRDGLHRLCSALRQSIRADRSMKAKLIKLGIIPLVG